ncbi:MAG: transporter [Acidobacteria bacterium]|nr:transporter [Acidobacteriota bacterium]
MAEEILENAFRPSSEEEEQAERDLGFGSVVTAQSRQRLLNQDGTFNVERTGLSRFTSLNLYHTLLGMSWRVFLGLVLLLYFLSNIVFGLFYASFGGSALVDTSSEPTENLFIRGFFFSVQTFATIGYGTIHPVGIVPNLLVTIESYYSLIANALITGLVFARFARPTARVRFSKVAVVAPYKDITGLMFRIVNARNNQLIQVGAQVLFARFENENGRQVRRFDILELERRTVSIFPLSWTIVHPIDSGSPFYGLTQNDLRNSDAEILVLLTATDETFAAVVHTRSSYKADEVIFGSKFVSIYNEMQAGEPISIDVKKLSAIEAAPN